MNRLTIIIISLFIVLGLGIGLIWPKYQEIKVLNKIIEEKIIELQFMEEYFSELSKISGELNEYQPELNKINTALPDEFFLPSLLNFIQKSCTESGLLFKKLGDYTIKEKADSKVKEIHLSLEVVGSYSSFKNFLSVLEKNSRLIEIDSLSFFSPSKEAVNRSLFSFKAGIMIHSY